MNWLDKLERKTKLKGITGLMTYIIGITGIVYGLNLLIPSMNIYDKLALSPSLIMQGEVWRIVTYIFIPPSESLLFILFVLYFYYLFGSSLEQEWGSFKFTVYYFVGMLGTTIVAFFTGGTATATYLNLSLFLAFAKIYPDFEMLLFFIIPIKVKYLGWLNWFIIGYTVFFQPVPVKLAAIASVINYFIFFFQDIVHNPSNNRRAHFNKMKFKASMVEPATFHKCTICGITEKDDPEMEFRYCSKCQGNHEYCMKHLKDHEHIV